MNAIDMLNVGVSVGYNKKQREETTGIIATHKKSRVGPFDTGELTSLSCWSSR